jgi:hypothetical protein
VLRSSTGKPVSSHDTSKAFIEALKQAMSEAHDIELLYDVWKENIETLGFCVARPKSARASFPPWSVTYALKPSITLRRPAMEALIISRRGTHRPS